MKLKQILLGAAAAVLVLASCTVADYPSKGSVDNTPVTPADSINFVKGFDASYNDAYGNLDWKDVDGTSKDFFQILASHGVNTIRLRVWVDPTNAAANGIVGEFGTDQGDNTIERTIRMARRAKAKGFKIMLDFHYSDYWTDPAKQVIPHSWQTITTADEMEAKIALYTKDVLYQMKAAGCLPEYVQVGNEINRGILVDISFNKTATNADAGIAGWISEDPTSNFAKYIVAGCKAVKEVDSNIKVILHVTNDSDKIGKVKGAMTGNEDYYDIIGLSYYPWENHGTVQSLRTNIATIKAANKDAMVVETSMYWNQDTSNDVVGPLEKVYNNMVDPDTGDLYENLTVKKVGTKNTVEGTAKNAYNVLKYIIDEVKKDEALGVCTWGGEINDWAHGMFTKWDYENGEDIPPTALDHIKIFETTPGDGKVIEQTVTLPPPLPTAVKITAMLDGANWVENAVVMTETSGVWTGTFTAANRWPNFNVIATIKGSDVTYKGGEVTLDTAIEMATDGGDLWCDVGPENAQPISR